ncbi:MAG TPA: hypothetical protein VFI22_19005, partial [Thermomicrobiales bacterium]|nr:hypothetical protein [Thermomicrobiales bacterium]
MVGKQDPSVLVETRQYNDPPHAAPLLEQPGVVLQLAQAGQDAPQTPECSAALSQRPLHWDKVAVVAHDPATHTPLWPPSSGQQVGGMSAAVTHA